MVFQYPATHVASLHTYTIKKMTNTTLIQSLTLHVCLLLYLLVYHLITLVSTTIYY